MQESILKLKSFHLAESIVEFCGKQKNSQNYIIANQLLRSGTSIGACVAEAGAAQTRRDFITKMAIASKEARETLYWLKLIHLSGNNSKDCESLIKETEEVIRLLTATVKTAQLNNRRNH